MAKYLKFFGYVHIFGL